MKELIITLCFLLLNTTVQAQEVFDIARKGSLEQIQKIKKTNPAQLDAVNSDGFTPVVLAAYYGNEKVLKYLVDNGVSLDKSTSYGTALMAATVKRNKDIVLFLLKKGADPNIADGNGSTALLFATMFQMNDMAEMLLTYKADPLHEDKRGNSALDYATQTKNQTLINLINSQR